MAPMKAVAVFALGSLVERVPQAEGRAAVHATAAGPLTDCLQRKSLQHPLYSDQHKLLPKRLQRPGVVMDAVDVILSPTSLPSFGIQKSLSTRLQQVIIQSNDVDHS